MSQKYWTSKVVLVHMGVTSVIAHIKIGKMHAALESKVLVVSAQDCGGCPMSLTIKWLQYQKQKMFWDESWIINYKNIMFGKVCYMGFCSTTSLQQAKSNSSASMMDGRKEVKEVRELDHPNLSKFIGASIEVPYISIITEYCPKGSLSDVLLNEDIPINWGFRGMAYLHQHKMFHGRLHSRNCVIDDRWVCKISDYGLTAYRKEDFEGVGSAFHCADINHLYCAPEVLLGSSSNATIAADVYSYSMILVEIATRSDLLLDQGEGVKMDIMWRPPLPELKAGKSDTVCPNREDYCELIKKCWSHNLVLRPTFEQVKKALDKMNPHKVSPVDMMMNLMEKYSKHLEAIVAERTQDLLQEKQKTDLLLYSMLPKPVADDLRQGRTAEAQSYSNATVYFSDIVGFTQLSGASTPHQVVDFLNQLYTTFDDIIDNYDIYKVETIGDAYMVVSGVPNENGINHAGEIASMALDLVNVCHAFKIPHKPTTQLRIRAGIHSGPVVAGVVGTKMPRYCLFGDTVNTASRMESTSEALKIQVSGTTADLLHTLGGYVLMCRGPLIVKGKGEMTTWWLQSKTDQPTDPLLRGSHTELQDVPVPVSN
ncbi:hypothetical protein NHX12_033615 [Muraenolepis orangiensis]|uniref:Guanylate cyclase n=1 Tax=Muraenolepis orangiensis TaxID=630683 RepID=A0A9Q0E219_9TELE|nr:hypothetical protein NHX12_033615 [Muraenolepis orangiensis]